MKTKLDTDPDPICKNGCGWLGWTVTKWSKPVHKHNCPDKDGCCQTHPEGCNEH